MEIHSLEIPYASTNRTYRYYFLGDVHWGTSACDEAGADATIKAISQDPFARVLLMGDLGEYIAVKDWRFEPELIADWVNKNDVGRSQEEYIYEKLYPIRSKIDGAIQGNHERTMEREWNLQVHRHLCERLGIKNLGYSAFVHYTFFRRSDWSGVGSDYRGLTIYLHHGYGGGRTMGADANRFDEMIRGYRADWYVAGHTHKRYAVPHIQHFVNRSKRLDTKDILVGRSGTYLRGIVENTTASYAERFGLPPTGTGSLIIEYSPQTGDAIAKI